MIVTRRRVTSRTGRNEVDSAAEYRAMAIAEPDPRLAKVYANLAAMEEAHIAFWEKACVTPARQSRPVVRPGAAACSGLHRWPPFRAP